MVSLGQRHKCDATNWEVDEALGNHEWKWTHHNNWGIHRSFWQLWQIKYSRIFWWPWKLVRRKKSWWWWCNKLDNCEALDNCEWRNEHDTIIRAIDEAFEKPNKQNILEISMTLKAYEKEKIMKLFKSAREHTHLTHKTHIDTTLKAWE